MTVDDVLARLDAGERIDVNYAAEAVGVLARELRELRADAVKATGAPRVECGKVWWSYTDVRVTCKRHLGHRGGCVTW